MADQSEKPLNLTPLSEIAAALLYRDGSAYVYNAMIEDTRVYRNNVSPLSRSLNEIVKSSNDGPFITTFERGLASAAQGGRGPTDEDALQAIESIVRCYYNLAKAITDEQDRLLSQDRGVLPDATKYLYSGNGLIGIQTVQVVMESAREKKTPILQNAVKIFDAFVGLMDDKNAENLRKGDIIIERKRREEAEKPKPVQSTNPPSDSSTASAEEIVEQEAINNPNSSQSDKTLDKPASEKKKEGMSIFLKLGLAGAAVAVVVAIIKARKK